MAIIATVERGLCDFAHKFKRRSAKEKIFYLPAKNAKKRESLFLFFLRKFAFFAGRILLVQPI